MKIDSKLHNEEPCGVEIESTSIDNHVIETKSNHNKKHFDATESLRQRLISMHELVRTRKTLIQMAQSTHDTSDFEYNAEEEGQGESSSLPPDLLREKNLDATVMNDPCTNRQSLLRFQNLLDESERKNQSSNKKHHQESNREKRRQEAIQTIEKQLESYSSTLLGTLFNITVKKTPNGKSNCSGSESMVDVIVFSMPLDEFKRNAELLMKLSCEKMCLDQGRGLMRTISTNPTSTDLFINMFGFIHCRFFQVHSSSEQNYLLKKLSKIFPSFIGLISAVPVVKHRDILFRHYPFVLAKGIYLGFQYLFPEKQSVFQGPFLRVLYVSLFRLLTGIDVSTEFVDTILTKLYPEDIKPSRDNKNKRIRKVYNNDDETTNTCDKSRTKVSTSTLPAEQMSLHDKALTNPQHHKDYFRNEKFLELHFDVNQISPLLQRCLGREGISSRPKHFIKRAVSIRHSQNNSNHSDDTFNTSNNKDDKEEDLIQRHMILKRQMKNALLETEKEYQTSIIKINQEQSKSLRSHETIKETVSVLMMNKGQRHHHQKNPPII